jgi:hypothetical protein
VSEAIPPAKANGQRRTLLSAAKLLTEREKRTRLIRELAKLDPLEEKQLAEEGLAGAGLSHSPLPFPAPKPKSDPLV